MDGCTRAKDSDLLSPRSLWLKADVLLSALPVNRAHLRNAKDFHPFTLSHETLSFLPLSALCVNQHGYLIGLF